MVVINPGWVDCTVYVHSSTTGELISEATFKAHKGFWFLWWWINLGVDAEGQCGDMVQLYFNRTYNWEIHWNGNVSWQIHQYLGTSEVHLYV